MQLAQLCAVICNQTRLGYVGRLRNSRRALKLHHNSLFNCNHVANVGNVLAFKIKGNLFLLVLTFLINIMFKIRFVYMKILMLLTFSVISLLLKFFLFSLHKSEGERGTTI